MSELLIISCSETSVPSIDIILYREIESSMHVIQSDLIYPLTEANVKQVIPEYLIAAMSEKDLVLLADVN